MLKKYLKSNNASIYINDVDINDYNNEAIEKDISYISQSELLFTDSLFENLKLGRDISSEEIIKTAKICLVDEIIKEKEFGFETFIEENGFNLSGGEKQRIVLARTLLNKSKILLIDEGTNQIDISLERRILKNIFAEFPDKTIISETILLIITKAAIE